MTRSTKPNLGQHFKRELALANKFFSAYACEAKFEDAVERITKNVNEYLPNADLAFVFFAGYNQEEVDRVGPTIQSNLGVKTLLGCNAVGVVHNDIEIENEPAISIWAAKLENTEILPMHLQFERSPDGGAIVGWPDETTGDWPEGSNFVLLGEPFGFPVDGLLERLNEDRPGVHVVGGMASGSTSPGESRLIFNDRVLEDGAIAIRINGETKIQTMVSQGCRPIGEPLVITKSERNIIYELGGKAALIQLKMVFDQLPTREKQLVQSGLHVGRVISEYKDKFSYGDFLIRNVVAIDSENGSISIGDYVRPGQTVQFHIRDHETASHDLTEMLAPLSTDSESGGLLFTCNGRGLNLFPDPNHDAGTISDKLKPSGGTLPLAGFFAAGEIGPVGGKNFLHGFTASLILFSTPKKLLDE